MSLPPRIPRAKSVKSVVKIEAKKTREARAHVELVKMLPCCATGQIAPSDPHHLMRGVERGTGMKAAGRYVIPVCRRVHDEIQPNGDPEVVLMERYGIDARALADALWAASPNVVAMQRVVFAARQRAALRPKGE